MLVLIVGALVAAFLISRPIWLITRRWPNSIGKALLINAASAVIIVIAAVFSSAGDGPSKLYLVLIFGGAQLIVLTFDVVGLVKFKPSTEPR
ncbi:hypothetical protein [Nitrobacter sp.]|jgi:hypothetical protein|uniref:hypothetical protein n=1 Tax=Nitrobacter sp. TaxID=29420 RepID=UPI003F64AED9